ncbi:MAG TPA: glycoside hydrolase family 44 protein [Lacipirellulaceae bacterium]|jgi:hypothetical protein
MSRFGIGRNHIVVSTLLLIALSATPRAQAIAPGTPGPGDVHFTINSTQNVKAISPWIYGMNGTSLNSSVTGDRMGGNRWTAYNWETNASNAGADYYFESDPYLVQNSPTPTVPGAAILPTLQADGAAHRSLIVTVPMAGYVSGDEAGPVQLADVASLTRFKQVVAKKSSIYSGAQAALSLTPDKTDNYVFTDEYVNWVESHKAAGQQIFYDLDNEPGLWGEPLPANWKPGVPSPCPPCNGTGGTPHSPEGRTHGEVHPYAPSYAELKNDTIAHAGAIKDVNPNAMVFGGVGYGWNDFTSLQGGATDPAHPVLPHPGGNQTGEMLYYDYLLQQVHAAELSQGRKLMDVLDLHWYPEATGGGVRITDTSANPSQALIDARVQAPRSLWDPSYTETSWITQYSTLGPIKLLPRVQQDINDFDPDTKVAISEYDYGGTNHISGGIAEADALGIFGQQGIFAANFWPVDTNANSQYASGGFKMFLNYNGTGGKFGDTSIGAAVGNGEIANSSVYASLDSTNPNRMLVMAINRTGADKTAAISLTYDRVFDHAEVYQLKDGNPNPVRMADIGLDQLNAFDYLMPKYSVTTLVLVSDGLPGDYNHDGVVDTADYTVWRDSFGQTGNVAADGNEDNAVDISDYQLWHDNFGRSDLGSGIGANAAVPEPSTVLLVLIGLSLVALAGFNARSTPRGRSHRPHGL